MAHNALIRANLAAWATGTVVTPAEFWAFDQAQFASINGDDGGTWAPSAAIIIGGSGLNTTGDLDIDGDVNVDAASTVTWQSGSAITGAIDATAGITFNNGGIVLDSNCILQVRSGTAISVKSGGIVDVESGGEVDINSGATLDCNGTADFSNGVTISAGTLTVSAGGASITGGLAVTSDGMTCVGGAVIDDGCIVNDGFQSNDGSNLGGTTTVLTGGELVFAGTAKPRYRFVALGDASVSKGINDGDIFYAAATTLSTGRTLTLSHTGASAGHVIRVVNKHTTNALNVDDATFGNIAILRFTSSVRFWADFVFTGTQWVVCASSE